MQNEEINSGKITTVINATLALYLTYLTIHIVILQFPQQLHGQLAWQFLRDCGGKQLDVMWPRSN